MPGDRFTLGDLLVKSIDLQLPGSVGIHPRLDGGRPQRFDGGHSPDQDRERQEDERHPGAGDADVGQGVLDPGVCPGVGLAAEIAIEAESPLALGFPEPEHDRAREQAGDRGHQVDQLEPDEV